jgi:hypothetical protein
MRASVTEYLTSVIRSWWARVSVAAGLVGLASELTNLVVPSWVWWVIVCLGVVLAQFTAFDNVRRQREKLAAQLAAKEAPAEAPNFVADLLEGRIFPTSDYPVIESGEQGFIIRGALAFGLDAEHEQLTSELQKLFEDTVAASAFEGWLQAQTSVIRAVPEAQWWERVQPTRSEIVSVARAPTRVPYYDYTLGGHCVLHLKPGLQPWHPGYGVLIASAVIRPLGQPGGLTGERPLSFEGLYEALTVIEAALVDQVAPSVLGRLTRSEFQPRAFVVLAIANGGSVADYVELDHYHWRRAAGSSDPNALYGQAASESAVRDPEARDHETRRWITRFLTDAGFSEFEQDVERLQRPRLPEPVPT